MALNQVGKLPRNVHNPSGTIIMRFSEFSYLETQPGSSSTRPFGLNFKLSAFLKRNFGLNFELSVFFKEISDSIFD